MKTLILVRHGKSAWDYQVGDKDRVLQERGINDAHLIAKIFQKKEIKIDAVYSSPANRALHTCMIFLRDLHISFSNFEVTEALYDFSGQSLNDFIRSLDNSLEKVMVFGHNNAFTYVANSLGNTYIENVPTAGLVQLQFDTDDWGLITKGTTVVTLFPKQFR
ncbi:SixA phosphatase family protein [Spongiimicrobium salis]|uniref:SixA phosphatase family protein n=1 Tax=Spongiimicrobium salis TaxID=1667022 RepID=UPI00374DD70E